MIGRALVVAGSLALVGCVSHYQPPSESEPHAIVKVRRVYERLAGERLDEKLAVNGHPALTTRTAAPIAGAPLTGAVLVHPVPAKLSVHNAFVHTEMRLITESYTESVPYTDIESYSCGTFNSPSTCTRTVTRYRQETRWRAVHRNVEVTDASCGRSLYFAPRKDGVYILDYTFRADDVCTLSCFEQLPAENGFRLEPCARPSGADIARLDEDE